MDEVVNSRLSSLSRELTQSAKQCSPERHIKQALVSHGYFQHARESDHIHSRSPLPAPPVQTPTINKYSWGKLRRGITEEDKKKTTQLISQYKEGKEVYRLKEPRSLFAKLQPVPTVQARKKLPLWPKEVECVPLTHKLLRTPPPHMEPFYKSSSEVISPKIRSIEKGCTTVYSNPRGPEKYFKTARVGPSRDTKSSAVRSPDDITLIFESRFESGNLSKAVQVGKWDYELSLSFDLYTKKHTQWFFFSVRNMKKDQTYRFTIVNLYKAGSLYNVGMQPVFYSTVGASNTGIGWTRRGHNIKYFKTPVRRTDTKGETYYFGLTWSHTFDHADDTCYFAHCYPYTYTDLQEDLQAIANNPVKSKFCKQRTLCQTLAGNPVPILTITSPVRSPEERDTKRAVMVTSRVHPGETNGSWMMKGLLDYLTGDSPDATTLRDSFIFKVIPMLNPDGVIVGNYRCSLAGRDLNRNYQTGYQDSYPVIWHVKNMIKTLSTEREVILYCDLHGHSRKQNVFIYGCDDLQDKSKRFKSRVFPKMLNKNTPFMFSYSSSKFGVHRSKEGTGRVVMWREMGITNSYTMEATFCGSLLGRMARYQFRTLELQQMGYYFCDTLLDYCDPDQSKVRCMMLEIEEEYREAVLARMAMLGQTIPPDVDLLDIEISSMDSSSDAGSDSSESDGPPMKILAKEKKKKKKKMLKSRRERNKQKAIIKMSHSVKLSRLPAPPVSSTVQSQSLTAPSATSSYVLSSNNNTPGTHTYSETTLSSGLGEGAKNGGIPMFIQERIDERQKRRSDSESADRQAAEDLYSPIQMKHVEAIAWEYLKQGLCAPLHLIDPRSSYSQLQRSESTQGVLPITISSMALLENGRPSRQPSQASSRVMLPQLKESSSGGGFTSQYMANHLQRMALNANQKELLAPPTPPTHSDTIMYNNNNNNNNSNSGDYNNGNSNEVDIGDLSYLLNKIRPNLVGKDNRPHVNYRGQMYPPQQARPEMRSRASKVPVPAQGRTSQAQHRAAQSQVLGKVNQVGVHNFTSQPRSAMAYDITDSARSRLQIADWALQENAMTQASRENHPWPLPVRQLSDPSNLFAQTTSTHPAVPTVLRHDLATGSGSSVEPPHTSNSGQQVLAVNSFSSNSGDFLSRSRPQLPHTLAPITSSSTNIIRRSTGEVLKLNSCVHRPDSMEGPAPESNYSQDDQFATSVLEHKRHVSKAVNDKHKMNSDKRLHSVHSNTYLDVELGRRMASCQPELSTAMGPAEVSNPALKEHARFMAEPHPLVVDKNGHYFNGAAAERVCKSSVKTKYRGQLELKENSPVSLGTVPKNRAEGAAIRDMKGQRYFDEDPEYYSELEDNVYAGSRRAHLQASVRRYNSTKPPNTSSGVRGHLVDGTARHDNTEFLLGRGQLQDLVRPSTNYQAQRPRPLRLKTKSAAPKNIVSVSSANRHSEIHNY